MPVPTMSNIDCFRHISTAFDPRSRAMYQVILRRQYPLYSKNLRIYHGTVIEGNILIDNLLISRVFQNVGRAPYNVNL